jgi:hypothetical protein
VGGVERVGDLRDEIQRALRLESALTLEQLAEVFALHVVHREVKSPLLLAAGERGDDMGVFEARCELRFTQETPAEALVTRQFGREQLQRDATAGRDLLGQINDAHRTFTNERLHAKAGEERAGTNLRPHRLRSA